MISRFFTAVAVIAAFSGCAGRPYTFQSLESVDLGIYADTQTDGDVRVTAAVPGEQDVRDIYGLDLYKSGIQPVWLKIENKSASELRFAPVGTDRSYFSPLEVAWKHRGGYSDEARAKMDERFHNMAMGRYISSGETMSGFVFTHVRPGAKAFNVDLFSPEKIYDFTFLLRVPGFVPDYANVDFDSIYPVEDKVDLDPAGLRDEISTLDCCTIDAATGEVSNPINVVLIGEGIELLYALLRASWTESSAEEAAGAIDQTYYGRKQDAIFRYGGNIKDGYYELRLWLSPNTANGQRMWVGHVKHVIDHPWVNPRPDPDIDIARSFLLQNLWYSQSLSQYGWIAGDPVVPSESNWPGLGKSTHFTDGSRAVLWLSGDPVSLLDVENVGWDKPSEVPE